MNEKISRTNSDLEFFNARLDEIRMSSHERLRAKASLARAEAIADLIVGCINGATRLLKTRVLCPIRRLAASFG